MADHRLDEAKWAALENWAVQKGIQVPNLRWAGICLHRDTDIGGYSFKAGNYRPEKLIEGTPINVQQSNRS